MVQILKRMLLGLMLASAALPVVGRADVLGDIKKNGVMVVGMEAAYVPYEYFDSGKIVGYDCDIADVVAQHLGVTAKFVDTDWAGIIPALYAHKFDVIMSAMTITGERAKKVLFAMPYGEATSMVLLRADDETIKTIDDLAGHAVGAQLGSAQESLAHAFDARRKAAGLPGFSDIKLYPHYPEAYIDLVNHRTDAVINALSSLNIVMRDQPGKYRVIGGIQEIKAYFGFAFRQDDGASMRDAANAVLAEMKKDGSLAKLQVKWFGAPMDTPNEVPATLP